MSWEKDRRYYTRSRRANGRIVREYVGGGAVGEIAAARDLEARRERAEEAEERRRDRERLREMEALDSDVEAFYEAVEVLAQAALVAAGYHRHDRGEWRKRREGRGGQADERQRLECDQQRGDDAS